MRLHCEDSGGTGEPLVLAHAIGCDHRMWEDLAGRLARRWRVLRIDTRGHGCSPVLPRPYSLEELAQDAADVLDVLGIEKTHWVGLSMGGMIGQAFALGHGARLNRLVLANTTSSYGPEGRAIWHSRAQLVAQGGLAAIAHLVEARYFSSDFREAHPGVVATVMQRFLETPVEGYLGCCDAIAELDFSATLGRIAAPTLVIAGGADAGTPPAMSEAIVRGIPGAKLAVIPDAAHLSAVENPTKFYALIRGFLDTVDPELR